MKHSLIILFFLLLSSPVSGDTKGGHTLYRWETFSRVVLEGLWG